MEIVKNISPRIKYFFLKKKEKQCFEHFKYFQTWFHNADHLLYYPQMSALSFHTFSVLSYQFLRNRTWKVLTLPYSCSWQNFNNKMNEIKKPEVSECRHPEYARQINSRIVELLLRQYYCLIFALPWKS